MAVKIFVEGIADIKFLKDYIQHKFNRKLEKEDIVETKGWTNIYSQNDGEVILNQMMKNSDDDGINLLIFDADSDYEIRLAEINKWKEQNKLDFHTFLWPNNSDAGDLEVTLEQIINQNNQPIFECWNGYENCLQRQTIKGRSTPLTTPARKTKIYGYLETLLGESKSQKEKIKERNRNYRDLNHWNLNSTYLSPLKTFLSTYFH